MTECTNCGRDLQPAWKYCITCGTRTDAPLLGVIPQTAIPRVEQTRRTNGLAVLALILGLLASPLAALFGHIALRQIRRSGERGRVVAIAAIVLGYLCLVALIALTIAFIVTNA